MSPSATRSSHSGKSAKTGERKAAHRTAATHPVREHKPVKPVRPKSKSAPSRPAEPRPKRVTKPEKIRKTAKPVDARPGRAREPKASVKGTHPAQAPRRRGRPAARGSSKEARETFASESAPVRDESELEADLVEEYIESDLNLDEEELVVPDEIELDPIGIPITLLDPELVDVPRPAPPKSKPKIVRTERRPQVCAGCGGTFIWLSVDGLCFSCLKRKLSQRKRDDDSFSGFTPEAEDDDES
jgi:hypothetical protein